LSSIKKGLAGTQIGPGQPRRSWKELVAEVRAATLAVLGRAFGIRSGSSLRFRPLRAVRIRAELEQAATLSASVIHVTSVTPVTRIAIWLPGLGVAVWLAGLPITFVGTTAYNAAIGLRASLLADLLLQLHELLLHLLELGYLPLQLLHLGLQLTDLQLHRLILGVSLEAVVTASGLADIAERCQLDFHALGVTAATDFQFDRVPDILVTHTAQEIYHRPDVLSIQLADFVSAFHARLIGRRVLDDVLDHQSAIAVAERHAEGHGRFASLLLMLIRADQPANKQHAPCA
jgi:hypothetical protein